MPRYFNGMLLEVQHIHCVQCLSSIQVYFSPRLISVWGPVPEGRVSLTLRSGKSGFIMFSRDDSATGRQLLVTKHEHLCPH